MNPKRAGRWLTRILSYLLLSHWKVFEQTQKVGRATQASARVRLHFLFHNLSLSLYSLSPPSLSLSLSLSLSNTQSQMLTSFLFDSSSTFASIYFLCNLKAHSHWQHYFVLRIAVDSCISAELGKFLSLHFCRYTAENTDGWNSLNEPLGTQLLLFTIAHFIPSMVIVKSSL